MNTLTHTLDGNAVAHHARHPRRPLPAFGAHALRLRLTGLVIVLVVGSLAAFQQFTASQVEEATLLAIEHEATLIAEVIEARALARLADDDVRGLQADIDQLVAARDRNDFEINVIRLTLNGSTIVASNVPDNVEPTDEEEHDAVLEALSLDRPVIEIEHDLEDEDDDDVRVHMDHPDYYLAPGQRVVGLTVPLRDAARELGAINVKLSLAPLDAKLGHIRALLVCASLAEAPVMVLGLGVLFNHLIFRPLRILGRNMRAIAEGNLQPSAGIAGRRDEIGSLAATFNDMARQLERTRGQLHQYLNPFAIEAAYGRARDDEAHARVEQREVSVLFVDIVSFTPLSERLGPDGTVTFLNRYYDLISDALVDAHAQIDKFVADEVVCVFDGAEHADNAVTAARSILAALAAAADIDVHVRIGVNSGPCIVADIGCRSAQRLDRTVIGDTINVAQRLMTTATPDTAHVADATAAGLRRGAPALAPAGAIALKGKRAPVEAWVLTR